MSDQAIELVPEPADTTAGDRAVEFDLFFERERARLFRALCLVCGAGMERAVALNAWGKPLRLNAPWWFWNLFGEQAVFLLSRKR